MISADLGVSTAAPAATRLKIIYWYTTEYMIPTLVEQLTGYSSAQYRDMLTQVHHSQDTDAYLMRRTTTVVTQLE